MRNVVRPAVLLVILLMSALLGSTHASVAHSSVAQMTGVPFSPAPASAMSPAASPLPSPANPPENPLVTTRVRNEFEAWEHGRINRSTYSPSAGGTYIDALVSLVSPDLAAIGPVQTVQYQTASLLLGDLFYRYEVIGTSGAVSVLYLLDANGKTDLIVFTPEIFRSGASPR